MRLTTLTIRNQYGLTLIEVLIALLILSTALFGLLSALAIALRNTQHAYYTSVAAQQAHNVAEKLRLDPANSMPKWQQHLTELLPNGIGQFNRDRDAIRIEIHWSDPRSDHVIQLAMYNPQ